MLRLSRPLSRQMIQHVQAVYPQEGCGLVAGQARRATKIYPIDNILKSQTVYEMDPRQQAKTMLAIEAQGEALLAIYHSHPGGPAYPSETDVKLAYYPDAIYLIVSLAERAVPVVRGFHIVEGIIAEVKVIIE